MIVALLIMITATVGTGMANLGADRGEVIGKGRSSGMRTGSKAYAAADERST